MTDPSPPEEAEYGFYLIHDIAVPVLAQGYAALVQSLSDNPSLRPLAREGGMEAVLASEALGGLRKRNRELVTEAEQEAERLMTLEVARRFPGHAVVGEEHGVTPGSATRWVFDPVDGTSAMIRTAIAEAFALSLPDPRPAFGITVGVVEGDTAVAGIVTELLAENGGLRAGATWIGAQGRPPTRDGVALDPAKAPSTLAEATLACTVPSVMFTTAEAWSGYQALAEATKTCIVDQNCIGFMRLGGGGIDIVYEADLAYHDVAALAPILEGAGLMVTDGGGASLNFHEEAIGKPFTILAAAPALHAEALAVIGRGVTPERNTFITEGCGPAGHVQKFPASR